MKKKIGIYLLQFVVMFIFVKRLKDKFKLQFYFKIYNLIIKNELENKLCENLFKNCCCIFRVLFEKNIV